MKEEFNNTRLEKEKLKRLENENYNVLHKVAKRIRKNKKLKDDKLKDHKLRFASKFPHEEEMSMKT